MKIGIYSDLHISRNNGIMPLFLDNNNENYTTRLSLCKSIMETTYKIFKDENVSMIVNCGDTFNSHTVTSDELKCFSEIYSSGRNIPEYILVGNHDKYNDNFNSIEMLEFFNTNSNISVINSTFYCEIPNEVDLYFISYYEHEKFAEELLKLIEEHPRKNAKAILFMHGDINGSTLFGNKQITNHIDKSFLSQYFDIVINGHIHCHEDISNDKCKIYNIGSIMTHSFADSNKHLAACYILDTNTGLITSYPINNQIVFRAYDINEDLYSVDAMFNDLDKLDNNIRAILKIKCKSGLEEIIDKRLKAYSNIILTKYILQYDNNILKAESTQNASENDSETAANINTSFDIKSEFMRFLKDSPNELKYDIDKYLKVVNQ